MSISIDEETQDLADIDVGRRPDDDTEWWYDGDYQALVRHGADLVECGNNALHDLQLPGWEDVVDDDDETTPEMIGGNVPPRKIQADVKLELKRTKVDTNTREEPRPNSAIDIEWDQLWDDFDIPREPQSQTQLALLVEASPQTSITDTGGDVVTDAIDRGEVRRVRTGKYIPGEWT